MIALLFVTATDIKFVLREAVISNHYHRWKGCVDAAVYDWKGAPTQYGQTIYGIETVGIILRSTRDPAAGRRAVDARAV